MDRVTYLEQRLRIARLERRMLAWLYKIVSVDWHFRVIQTQESREVEQELVRRWSLTN